MSAENSRRRVSFRSDLIDIIDDEMEPPVHYDSEMEAAVLYDVPCCDYPCSELYKAGRDVVRYDYAAPGTSRLRLRAGAGSYRRTRVKLEPDSQDARCDVYADDDSVAGQSVCSYRPKRRHSVAFVSPRRPSVSARLAAPPPPPPPPVMPPPPPIPAPGSAAPTALSSNTTALGAQAGASAWPRARHDEILAEMLARRKARKHVIVKASKLRSAAALPGGSGSGAAAAAPKAPPAALETYGRDMTAAAGGMDPVIGRDGEIDRVVCILCRRTKNSAVLIGAPGVGKTAIAEGLAQRVAAGEVPAALSGARVVELDLGAMVAGTTYRGMFEERVKKVIQEAEDADGKVILFIDEMHMLLGAGRVKDSSMDAANLLKSALARGRIRCVGATTFDEHRKHVERDPAFERRFQKVPVEEPSLPATIAILQGLKKKYEEHHNTTIEDAAIVAAARLAKRYITDRQFPDKAIDLMDEACTITRMQTDNQLKANNTEPTPVSVVNEAIVRPYQVAQVVSRWTGIPVNTLDQNEKEKLMHLADRLQERVVGQEEAVNLVAQAVLRSRAGMDEPGKPIGSFLFLGSTGVGKTELAKALAEQLFDSEKMLIRFDMTEFVDTHSVLRLIGAPPSYHGHEDGGQLTEKVRQRPYSVILFDEIEKASQAVVHVLLQLLDDGILTDGKGRTIDFKNTIIIMTSNLGAEYLMEAMDGQKSMEAARDLVIKQAQKHFKPEFLNRLGELVIFEPLSQDKLREIANNQMKGIIARVADSGIILSASDAALDVVLSESHNPLYGARPIRRWLQKNVMTKLSEMLVKGEVNADTSIIIDASEDKKDLKYLVVNNNAAERLARRLDKMPVFDIPPIAKKLKGVTIPSVEK
ncbi:hypothetical protein EJB05_21408 [Eragrostis curvula]|uniref:Clp R domain-containing protein n=1 Tax=Eragrostis curvula TaxID=38414 RepID=A0A5J9V376_9POAL|nr:hypothetical protein EJB05_21408 [Eragrostis curvula]